MNYTNDDKFDMVLNFLANPDKGNQIAEKYKIALSTLYKWKKRFLEGARQELNSYKPGPIVKNKETSTEKNLKSKISDYENRLAELAIENEILKKKENWTEGPLL